MDKWLTYSPVSGHGNGTITITASTLSELEDRVATIVVSNSQYSLSASTSVTQKGAQLTAITFENLTWVTDVPASGGTATKDNCSYTVIGQYTNGTTDDITEHVTVSGSLNVPVSTEMARQNVGNLTLTANYDGFSASTSVSAYQAAPSITGIGFTSLVWVMDVPASGGTATKDNCTYTVYAYYDTNMSTDITDVAVITGSLVVPATTATTRQNVGTLVLTASYDAFSATSSVTAYQIIYGADEYLTFEIISGGTIYFRRNNDSIRRITISYSKDNGVTWTNFESSSSEVGPGISVQSGDVVLFKGDNAQYCINIAPDRYYSFSGTTARFNIKGNIMSLINSTEFETISTLSSEHTFYHIFESCTGLTSAEHLILPAITLTGGCYANMFDGCTSLTTAPILYATTLAGGCYSSMFSGCTSLTTAPDLPATTLASSCYEYMFNGCTSLTSVPELNATTLAGRCYCGMFANCTGITSVPSDYLPITALTFWCYNTMFMNCTSLTTVPELPATTLTDSCYNAMFYGCSSLTTVPELPATTLAQSCYHGMFNGCTSLTTAPISIGTSDATLAPQCCQGMFQNCKSLTTAPELPATTLANDCYGWMFNGCTSLTKAPELPATTLAYFCYEYMFWDCTGLTTAPSILPATTLGEYCCYRMFYNCTSLTTAPVSIGTSASTLAESCCHSMFKGCKSLATAPELPATTLASSCYNEMFNGCTSLNYIKCLAIHDSALRYTDDWVYGVASTGTFVKAPNMNDWTTGVSGIPTDWIVVNYGLTGISISDLTWVIDIPSSGGTADKNNCSYSVYANYNNGTVIDITNQATVSGSLNVSASTVETRHSAGTLTLTASYSGFTDSDSIDVYQEANITDYSKEYLTLIISSDGVIRWKTGSNSNKKTISYSKDNGITWTNITSSTGGTKISVSAGDKIKFKGDNESYNGNWFREDYYVPFTVEGNIMSLIDSEGFATATTLTSTNTFSSLFSSSDCTSAENFVLPATTLTDNCYQNMFKSCSELTTPPSVLPATTLATNCYDSMFYGCESLTTAPALPATTLANSCYVNMFRNCTKLTTAPELPATTLANNCYEFMFDNCTSLTTPPSVLPATTLANNCCHYMFSNCTSLTQAPVLPATTLVNSCYLQMFLGCTSLTTAPELPATTLAERCYNGMFDGCTSLNYIKCLATDISATYCTSYWVDGVASTGTFIKNPNMTSWTTGPSGIPKGWTVIDAT